MFIHLKLVRHDSNIWDTLKMNFCDITLKHIVKKMLDSHGMEATDAI